MIEVIFLHFLIVYPIKKYPVVLWLPKMLWPASQYFLNTTHLDEDFIDTLSRKSNVPLQQTTKLFTTINQVQQSLEMEDKQLLSLNQQIENFYKHKK